MDTRIISKGKSLAVGILGGTGYGAAELLRLLSSHRYAELISISSSSHPGENIRSCHPHLGDLYPLTFESELDIDALASHDRAVVFSALPHGVAAAEIQKLYPKLEHIRLIDLSGDFRLEEPSLHDKHYPNSKRDESLRANFVYGLPEFNREDIRGAKLVANPGCFATVSSLSLLPLAKAGLINSAIIDAKTGTSGAGRKPSIVTHHPLQNSNLLAYKILSHRHEAEIAQLLEKALPEGKSALSTAFVPHLLPISRGIFTTSYCTLVEERSEKELYELYETYYDGAPFVRLRKAEEGVQIRNVVASNFCDMSLSLRGRQVVVTAAIDNLLKGMAGQAIQNMNLVFDLPQEEGLGAQALGVN